MQHDRASPSPSTAPFSLKLFPETASAPFLRKKNREFIQKLQQREDSANELQLMHDELELDADQRGKKLQDRADELLHKAPSLEEEAHADLQVGNQHSQELKAINGKIAEQEKKLGELARSKHEEDLNQAAREQQLTQLTSSWKSTKVEMKKLDSIINEHINVINANKVEIEKIEHAILDDINVDDKLKEGQAKMQHQSGLLAALSNQQLRVKRAESVLEQAINAAPGAVSLCTDCDPPPPSNSSEKAARRNKSRGGGGSTSSGDDTSGDEEEEDEMPAAAASSRRRPHKRRTIREQ